MPRSDRTRKIAKDLDRTRVRLGFPRRYHTLYKEYAQSELHFVDDNTLALTLALHPDDQAAFAFDTSVFDWKTYIQEVHCPSITAPVRRMDAIRSKRGNRPSTMKDLDKNTAGSAALAIFDLDGTIMSTNVIEQYLWARLPELSSRVNLPRWAKSCGGFRRTCGPSSETAALSARVTAATGARIWPPWSASSTPRWLLIS